MAGFEVINPAITFPEEYELDLGDIHLRLIYWGDGICHSSIFIHVVEDNLLVGMGMGGDWMPGFYGKTTLKGIRRGISLYQQLSDASFPIDRMIGVHNPDLLTSRQTFQRHYTYLQKLLDDLIKARQKGLSLQQAIERLSLNQEYTFVRDDFKMPEDLNQQHQKNVETIWTLLLEEEKTASD